MAPYKPLLNLCKVDINRLPLNLVFLRRNLYTVKYAFYSNCAQVPVFLRINLYTVKFAFYSNCAQVPVFLRTNLFIVNLSFLVHICIQLTCLRTKYTVNMSFLGQSCTLLSVFLRTTLESSTSPSSPPQRTAETSPRMQTAFSRGHPMKTQVSADEIY